MKSADRIAHAMMDCMIGYGLDAFDAVIFDLKKATALIKEAQRNALLHAAEIAEKTDCTEFGSSHAPGIIASAIRAEADKFGSE